MKQFLFTIFLFIGYCSFGQNKDTVIIAITLGKDTACFGSDVEFEAFAQFDSGTISYQWLKNGAILTDSTREFLFLKNITYSDTGVYRCTATNGITSKTSKPEHLYILPKLTIDTLYRYNDLGCPPPAPCKGQFKTHISGGTGPYTYDWGGGKSQDTIVYGLCAGYHTLTVRDHDSSYCITRQYYVDVLKLPKIEITKVPKDTIYLTHPTLKLSFPDSSKKYLTNWQWEFGDSAKFSNINPAIHDYSKTGEMVIKLGFTDQNGCDTTILDSIKVKTVDLVIPKVFTPNGDGFNDTFEIKEKAANGFKDIDLLEVYQSDILVVFDRWGKKVYEKTNYRSGDWNGGHLSDGVYFYLFKGHGPYNDEVYKGSVTILRGK